MTVIRGWTGIVCGVLVVAGVVYAAGDRQPPATIRNKQQAALMLAKIACSQRVVDGLVCKDFDEIGRGAAELVRICQASEWTVRSDKVYVHYRDELHRQAQKLSKMAKEKNLDGAAFTYMHSLTTCIGCHEHCRDVLHISTDDRPKYKIVPIPVNEE